MNLQLKGKVALVTAASKGLGKGAALEFGREGARVVICPRSGVLDSAATEIREQTGAEVLVVKANVTRQADINAVVEATLEKIG